MSLVLQPKVTMYTDTDASRASDYIVLPKTTPLNEVIDRCFREGSYGFSRSSVHDGCGKYYIRPPHKSTFELKEYKGISFFVLEY